MKVRVTITVDVDPERWNANYGTGTDPKDVREDVKRYVEGTVDSQLRMVGVLVEEAA